MLNNDSIMIQLMINNDSISMICCYVKICSCHIFAFTLMYYCCKIGVEKFYTFHLILYIVLMTLPQFSTSIKRMFIYFKPTKFKALNFVSMYAMQEG